jgi:2-polyprenyl-6-methoxyphenol hydroxylase-like FAD-dependent oxidoreductase
MYERTEGSHAIVVGAGIAGLLAASVLGEAFPRVTVYDRDMLPDVPAARPCVPQSRQAHGLHARGVSALDELLPGFRDEMLAAGGVDGDVLADINWYLDGHLAQHAPAGLRGIGMTRRGLERMIRARVEKLPGVKIVARQGVDGLVVEGERVAGVCLRPVPRDDPATQPPSGPVQVVLADLVVDAAGRGSRTPAWLGELGYPQPRVSRLRVDLVYVTRHYQRLPGQLGGITGVAVVPYPGHRRGAALIGQEGDQWVLTLAGMLGEDPPTDDAGMLAYASSLAGPEIASVMRTSGALDSPAKMRFPASVRRHYEKLDRMPSGLIVMGDALCSLNPVYAQGMTVSALQALALRKALADSGPRRPAAGSRRARAGQAGTGRAETGRAGAGQLEKRFFRAADKLVSAAWAMSVAGDLRFPEVAGKRKPADRLVNAYLTQLRAAASVDPEVGRVFVRVANMIDPPSRLLSPAIMARVVLAAGRPGRVGRLPGLRPNAGELGACGWRQAGLAVCAGMATEVR